MTKIKWVFSEKKKSHKTKNIARCVIININVKVYCAGVLSPLGQPLFEWLTVTVSVSSLILLLLVLVLGAQVRKCKGGKPFFYQLWFYETRKKQQHAP